MNNDKAIREQLLKLLRGGNAHMSFANAVKDYPIEKANDRFPNAEYTPWHLLEHIRITQHDILNFCQNPDYQYLHWPKDYWPAKNAKANKKDWENTISQFQKDLRTLEKIVKDPEMDLYAKIDWGEGQNILREILTVCDHTAYHVGEFAILRQVMDTWAR